MFLSLYRNQNVLDSSNTYFIENNSELHIVALISFIYADKDRKFKVCQYLTHNPNKAEISVNNDHYHSGKSNLQRDINETVRLINDKCTSKGMNKDNEIFIYQCEIWKRA